MAFCPNCGTRLEDGARFCVECGTSVPPQVAAGARAAATAGGAPSAAATQVRPAVSAAQVRPAASAAPAPSVAQVRPAASAPSVPSPVQTQPVASAPVPSVIELPAEGGTAELNASAQAGQITLSMWTEATASDESEPARGKGASRRASARSSSGSGTRTVMRSSDSRSSGTRSGSGSSSGSRSSSSAAKRPGSARSSARSKLPLILAGVAAIALVAVITLYVVPLFISHPHDPHEDEALTPPTQEQPVEDGGKPSGDSGSEDGGKSDGSGPGTDSGGNPGLDDEKPSTSNEPDWEQFSTSDTPVIGEFDWYRDDIEAAGPSDSATMLYDFASAQGGWKAYILSEAPVEGAGQLEYLLNVYVSGIEADTEVVLDWYWARNKATKDNWEDTKDDTVYSGSWRDGGVVADGGDAGRVSLTDFWVDGDTEYGVGYVDWGDGGIAIVALVRP